MSKAFVQRPAPDFTAISVESGEFKEVSLGAFKGKWLVLFFYPLDFTFVCPTEILAFDRALPRFAEINTAVVGVSTDSEFSHLKWAELDRKQGGLGPNLRLPLLADKNMKISRDYGVLLEEQGIALRGLFLVDPRGILRQITINDLPVGRSVEETLRLVKAFQYTDEFGEVCPADWIQGDATIKANPKDSLEYFGAADNKRSADELNGNGNGNANKRAKVCIST
ncbi:hypothetical protein BS47DRAFT_1330230 [Hydnum rufescens UP504]|uniref:thioredoxin-dependent peroxiredoxin n=1 Tax=Hydnum rufescens UP504 TaxID=1448309 RepID=A0A9P6DRV0_9AGAM|nr:hypothetical protein BS47DRAFT_1330230 [Hydnum rufescens UP504]